ncbi:MAG: malQ [Chthoniobacteraceae bacterium]|nr:malQ [Chthoniobacteraceae bacterium]
MTLTPEKLLAGLLAPLFALRGENDLGIGDVGALREFVDWAADLGFGVVQLLPINETGNDNSPYNAISSVALDPTTIEIAQVEDLTKADIAELTHGLDALRSGPVAYPLIKGLKQSLLRRAFANFSRISWKRNDTRARRFRAFQLEQEAWLSPYALFRVLMETNGGTERWDTWPEDRQTAPAAWLWLKNLPVKERRQFELEMRFFMYVQWIAWGQWQAVKLHAEKKGVALMGDVPFGVSYYSADVFGEPDLFDHRWSGGAPPEPLFKDDAFTCKWGQNWGVPLYRWAKMREDNFSWWRRRVRMVRDVFHLFRIDHVLGFYRIYSFPWRPQLNADFLPRTKEEAMLFTDGELPRFREHDDETPEGKAANRVQGEAFLRVLLEETGNFRLIGEDLGTVPEYVRPSLHSLQIPGFRIPFWEHTTDKELVAGAEYDRLSVAAFATHDHEPLRAIWERWMRVIEEALHQPHALAAERDATWREVRQFAAWAGFDVPCITLFDAVHTKFLAALFRSNSWLAICMITDLFGTTQRFNVPGAVSEANWSQRLATSVKDWSNDEALNQKMTEVRSLLAQAGRLI